MKHGHCFFFFKRKRHERLKNILYFAFLVLSNRWWACCRGAFSFFYSHLEFLVFLFQGSSVACSIDSLVSGHVLSYRIAHCALRQIGVGMGVGGLVPVEAKLAASLLAHTWKQWNWEPLEWTCTAHGWLQTSTFATRTESQMHKRNRPFLRKILVYKRFSKVAMCFCPLTLNIIVW